MTGQGATVMHSERRQKGGPAIAAPFPRRRLCLSLLPVDSRAAVGQPTNNGQHDISHESFDSCHSYSAYETAARAPLDRYRMVYP